MFSRKTIWLRFGLLALAIRVIFEIFPSLADLLYRNFIFQIIRVLWDSTIAFVPFPIAILLSIGLLFWVWHKVRRGKRRIFWNDIPRSILNTLGFFYFWFMVMWGFNYQASGLFGDEENKSLSEAALITLIDWTETKLLQDLEAKPHDYQSLNIEEYETELREMLVVTMHEFGWKTSGEVRCRVVSPSGWMRKLGIAGIYWPYSAEGHIDDSFLFSTKLFSMIHEMSHGYGVTDEGEANFIALKTLLDQEDAFFRISGELGLLRDALGKLKHINEQLYLIRREALDPKSTLLLDELNANSSQYPPFFPGLATFLNDIYLKMQGVEAGIESYNQYLWMAWKYVKNL